MFFVGVFCFVVGGGVFLFCFVLVFEALSLKYCILGILSQISEQYIHTVFRALNFRGLRVSWNVSNGHVSLDHYIHREAVLRKK